MGKEFGNLAKIRGIITYRISPFEINYWKGYFTHDIPRLWANFVEFAKFAGPAAIFCYMTIQWANKEYEKNIRKNPKDYENDE